MFVLSQMEGAKGRGEMGVAANLLSRDSENDAGKKWKGILGAFRDTSQHKCNFLNEIQRSWALFIFVQRWAPPILLQK